jgi:hypothetical protein
MPHLHNTHATPFAVMLNDFEDSYKESIMRLICSIAYHMSISDAQLGALVDMVRAINIAAPRARNEYHAYFREDLIGKIHPQLYSRIAWFLQQNQDFLRSVPFANFMRAFPEQVEISPEHFQLICRNLWRQYYTPHAMNAHPGLAFEIHNFANQMVSDESTGDTGRFNDIILRKINQQNAEKALLSLGTSVALLCTTMNEMLQEDKAREKSGKTKHYSTALREEILTWAVGCTNGGGDAAALCSVVTYLNSNPELLKTWLLTFLDESERAYGRSQGSCIKGVRERVITSLRNATPEDPLFAAAFQQAETTEMLGVKIASLNFGGRDPSTRSVEEQSKLASWTKLLYSAGARSTTSFPAAQAIFSAQLESFFGDLLTPQNKPTIDSVIENSVELFDSYWSDYFVPEIRKLEQKETDTSTQASQETLFDQFIKEYLSTALNSTKEAAIRRAAHTYFRANNKGQLTEEQFVRDMDQYFRK